MTINENATYTPNETDIGKTVAGYTPNGSSSYSTTQGGAERSGYQNQTHNRDTGLKWKLWKVDTAKNEIQIISDRATSSRINLQNITGYNNGVRLLDEICSNVYGNSTIAAKGGSYKARNMKLSDIIGESGTDTTVIKSTTTNQNNNGYGTTYIDYTSGTFPKIWVSNERNVTTIASREEAGNSWLSASDYTTANSSSNKMRAYETRWYNMSMKQNSFQNATYFNMVMGTAIASNDYWLSTRYAYPSSSSYCYFGLEYVGTYGVGISDYLYDSTHYSESNACAVRPLVSIPLKSVTITNNSDTQLTISY